MTASEWPQFRYHGVIRRVVDADTCVVSLDLGLRVSTDVALRIAGINAPEINSGTPEDRDLGKAARDFVVQYTGRAVCVRTYKDRRSFSRYVGDILLIEPEGELLDLADIIVTAGHAKRV